MQPSTVGGEESGAEEGGDKVPAAVGFGEEGTEVEGDTVGGVVDGNGPGGGDDDGMLSEMSCKYRNK